MAVAASPAPARSADAAAPATKHCIVRAGQRWYAIPASAVHEVALAPPLVRIPGGAPVVEGMGHMRNQFVPVLRLDALVGRPADLSAQAINGTREGNPQMLVLRSTTGLWAVVIDQWIALESIDTYVSPDLGPNHGTASPILGTAQYRDQILRLVNPHALYERAEEALKECWENLSQGAWRRCGESGKQAGFRGGLDRESVR